VNPLPGPSKTFSTSTGRTAISGTSPPKASISLPRSAIETLPITATASSRCRRRPPSTAVKEIRPEAQTVPSRLCRWHRRLTPSFLTGQKCRHHQELTTARPLPSSNARRRHRRRVTLPGWICRSTLAGTETAAELDDIGAVTDDATVVSRVTLIAASSSLTGRNRDHQLDLVHVGRTLGYTLWDDGVFRPDRRKEIVSGGDRRGVPSEELCGEASSSGGVRGDPLADRANEERLGEDSVATGEVRVSKGCRGIFGGGCRRL